MKIILKYQYDIEQRNQNGYLPAWNDLVERWYQLDETSFSVCEAIYFWKQQNLLPEFDQIIFICQKGSNLADADFVSTDVPSPAKFVYTLPSIAPAVMNQLLGISCAVFCLCAGDDIVKTQNFATMISTADGQRGLKTFTICTSPDLNQAGYRDVTGQLF